MCVHCFTFICANYNSMFLALLSFKLHPALPSRPLVTSDHRHQMLANPSPISWVRIQRNMEAIWPTVTMPAKKWFSLGLSHFQPALWLQSYDLLLFTFLSRHRLDVTRFLVSRASSQSQFQPPCIYVGEKTFPQLPSNRSFNYCKMMSLMFWMPNMEISYIRISRFRELVGWMEVDLPSAVGLQTESAALGQGISVCPGRHTESLAHWVWGRKAACIPHLLALAS